MSEERNCAFEPINGQKLCKYSRVRFGWRRIADNGCGLLAIYNALGLTGHVPSFDEIHRYLHAWYRPRFFGTHPWRIKQYLSKRGLAFRSAKTIQELDGLLKTGGVAIVVYWNRTIEFMGVQLPNLFRGAHCVTVEYAERYTVYNRFSNRACTYEFETLEECLAKRYFMEGIFLKREDALLTSENSNI